jgi:hypothetical protein
MKEESSPKSSIWNSLIEKVFIGGLVLAITYYFDGRLENVKTDNNRDIENVKTGNAERLKKLETQHAKELEILNAREARLFDSVATNNKIRLAVASVLEETKEQILKIDRMLQARLTEMHD